MTRAAASKGEPGGSGRRGLIAALAVAAACAVALSGCQLLNRDRVEAGTAADKRLERGLTRFAHRGPKGATVPLERFTRFEWDRVYGFVGYRSHADINAAVGAEVYSDDGYLDEDVVLLVFTSGDEIAHASTRLEVRVRLRPERPLFSRADAVLKAVPPRGETDLFPLRFVGPGRPGEDR